VVGTLWFDNDSKRSIAAKVRAAAARHLQRHGERPDVCQAHPETLGDLAGGTVDGIELQALPSVLRNHFWVGVRDA
jgi:hypothetical protein